MDRSGPKTVPNEVHRAFRIAPSEPQPADRLFEGRLLCGGAGGRQALRADPDQPDRQAVEVHPRKKLTSHEVDLAAHLRRCRQGSGAGQGPEVRGPDLDAHGAADHPLGSQPSSAPVSQREHLRLHDREIGDVHGEGDLRPDALLDPAGRDRPGVPAPRQVVQVRAGDLPDGTLHGGDVAVGELGGFAPTKAQLAPRTGPAGWSYFELVEGVPLRMRQPARARPVYFPRVDGEMEWTTASGDVVNASFQDELTKDQMSMRLRTALSLEGEWMPSVLSRANEQLRAMRQDHRDAGGLVIAIDQDHAQGIARLLRNRFGTPADVVISDDPTASKKIAEFAHNDRPWLVAVRMVSEGVDIPRLRVGVFATTTSTELFFRQAVGRFVRWQAGRPSQKAYVYIPDDPRLRTHAFEIAEARRHVLRPPGSDDDGDDFHLDGGLDDPAVLDDEGVTHADAALDGAVHDELLLAGDLPVDDDAATDDGGGHDDADPSPASGVAGAGGRRGVGLPSRPRP